MMFCTDKGEKELFLTYGTKALTVNAKAYFKFQALASEYTGHSFQKDDMGSFLDICFMLLPSPRGHLEGYECAVKP
jgi:hypothetical protein